MSIFTRLSDIVNSNISALLYKAENPEKMIRMVIQEMEETLVEVRSGTAKVIADKKTLKRRVDTLRKQAQDWEQKAELALLASYLLLALPTPATIRGYRRVRSR